MSREGEEEAGTDPPPTPLGPGGGEDAAEDAAEEVATVVSEEEKGAAMEVGRAAKGKPRVW